MGGKRQNIQYSLALDLTGRGESPLGGHQGTEPPVAKPDPESPALAEQIMEEVCERENCETAWKHVRKNKGGPGVDGMTIDAASRPYATTISTRSASPDSTPLLRLNPDEPPWYGPVCPVVWEGWHREVPLYPDQSPFWNISRPPEASLRRGSPAREALRTRGKSTPWPFPQGNGNVPAQATRRPAPMSPTTDASLIDARGRKYLTVDERQRFLAAVRAHPKPTVQTLARTLVLTGCRVTEALSIRACDVDLVSQEIRIATLKRRREHWRAVPVPEDLVSSTWCTASDAPRRALAGDPRCCGRSPAKPLTARWRS